MPVPDRGSGLCAEDRGGRFETVLRLHVGASDEGAGSGQYPVLRRAGKHKGNRSLPAPGQAAAIGPGAVRRIDLAAHNVYTPAAICEAFGNQGSFVVKRTYQPSALV